MKLKSGLQSLSIIARFSVNFTSLNMCTNYADEIGKKEYLVYKQSAKCTFYTNFHSMCTINVECKTVIENSL